MKKNAIIAGVFIFFGFCEYIMWWNGYPGTVETLINNLFNSPSPYLKNPMVSFYLLVIGPFIGNSLREYIKNEILSRINLLTRRRTEKVLIVIGFLLLIIVFFVIYEIVAPIFLADLNVLKNYAKEIFFMIICIYLIYFVLFNLP